LGFVLICNNGGSEMKYKKITHVEAKKIMDTEKDIIILDVRTPEEFADSYIDGAINIPNEQIKDSLLEQIPDKSAKILVYCRSGRRSQEAAKKLIKIGYTNVYDFGGLIDWPFEIIM